MRSGFPKINREELAEFVTSWPPFDEQQRIASAIELCDREQDAIENELTKLHLLKSGLMADLLSGRVRVPAGLEVA
jgi:type I restriction enzyme S subunit